MKEYTLWGKVNPPKENIILHEPERKTAKEWENLLNHKYTVPDLQKLAQPFLKLLTKTIVQIQMNNGTLKDASEVLYCLQKKVKTKMDWLQLAVFFLAEKWNLLHYVQTLEKEEIDAWKLIIFKLYANNRMLKDATGKSWLAQETRCWYGYETIPIGEASWFTIVNSAGSQIHRSGYREKDAFFFLLPAFRKVFAPLFFPEVKVIPDTIEELPVQGLFTFQGEADFFRCFPLLQTLYEQEVLVMGSRKMAATTIKKVSKQVKLKEFWEGEEVSAELSGIRSSLVLPVLALLFEVFSSRKKVETLLKEFPKFLSNYYAYLIPVLLPNINGIKSNKLSESTVSCLIERVLSMLIRTNSGWISVNKMKESFLVYSDAPNSLQIFMSYQLENMDLFNKVTGEYVHLGNLIEHLGIPFLKGLLFLMGGLGMLELAYEYPSVISSSVFHSLQYVRLTELGRYVLGLTSTYTPPLQEEQELFQLDENRLIIRSLVENNPYETLLQDTAIPIGSHRFLMNNDSFLKNCKTEKDVKNKMDFFRQFVCQGDMPEIWSEFFKSLLKQCHPLKVSKCDYLIYQLDSANKEFVHLLTTDPVLKSIVIRAEGYKILVEGKNRSKLVERLKTYGYLL